MRRLTLGVATAVFVLLGTFSVAHAQYRQQPPPPYGPPPGYYPPPPAARYVYRSGLVIGGSLGFGGISSANCGADCGASIAVEGHVGGMLNPRFALMGDFWFNAHSNPNIDSTTFHGIYTLAGQYWLTDILWVKGGAGLANLQLSDTFGTFDDETGFAVMAAAGVELIHATTFALDLQGRYGHGFYDTGPDIDNLALTIGLNWY